MEQETKKITELKVRAGGIHLSPRKVRLVADLVRNLPVTEALAELDFVVKKAAGPLKKLLRSGVANAANNFQIEQEQLFIKKISVDGGRVFLRFTPRAQGRAFPLKKRTSDINLILGVNEALKIKAKKAKVQTPRVAEPERVDTEPVAELGAPPTETQSRWKFWKKKAKDPSQLAPKQDVKGKKYTSFDRRGNM